MIILLSNPKIHWQEWDPEANPGLFCLFIYLFSDHLGRRQFSMNTIGFPHPSFPPRHCAAPCLSAPIKLEMWMWILAWLLMMWYLIKYSTLPPTSLSITLSCFISEMQRTRSDVSLCLCFNRFVNLPWLNSGWCFPPWGMWTQQRQNHSEYSC